MAHADDIRMPPEQTDKNQLALDVGIIPIKKAQEEVVTCPVCFGTSVGKEVRCDACHNVGQLKIVTPAGGGVPEYRAIDTDLAVIGIPAPPARPVAPQKADVQRVLDRLTLFANLLRGIDAGNKLYAVSVRQKSPLDGGEETVTVIHTWAKNEQQAGYIASHDVTQRQWGQVVGKPELKRNAPVVTMEWLQKVMDIPIP